MSNHVLDSQVCKIYKQMMYYHKKIWRLKLCSFIWEGAVIFTSNHFPKIVVPPWQWHKVIYLFILLGWYCNFIMHRTMSILVNFLGGSLFYCMHLCCETADNSRVIFDFLMCVCLGWFIIILQWLLRVKSDRFLDIKEGFINFEQILNCLLC